MKTYYAVKVGNDRFDLRQERFRATRNAGKEHPHDLMMAGFPADAMRDFCKKHGWDADLSTIDECEVLP